LSNQDGLFVFVQEMAFIGGYASRGGATVPPKTLSVTFSSNFFFIFSSIAFTCGTASATIS